MSHLDKPWMQPPQYNDDRFAEPQDRGQVGGFDEDERDERDVDEILNRPPRPPKQYECNDTTPIDYSRGPHDHEFGVDDEGEAEPPDDSPMDIDGPDEDEFDFDAED